VQTGYLQNASQEPYSYTNLLGESFDISEHQILFSRFP